MDDEDLIAREDMVVTVSRNGYIKRVPLTTYRAQRRGGKGRSGMSIRDEDFVTRLFVANTHTPVLFFSSRGIVYKEKVWRLPIGTPQSRGKALINMLPLQQGEAITSILALPEDEDSWKIALFAASAAERPHLCRTARMLSQKLGRWPGALPTACRAGGAHGDAE